MSRLDPNRPTIDQVGPIVKAYYDMPGNGAGGSLHIVLDDGNIDDDSVQFCIENARDRGDVIGERLGMLLLRMSKTQRRKVGCRYGEVRLDLLGLSVPEDCPECGSGLLIVDGLKAWCSGMHFGTKPDAPCYWRWEP